jgi:predicted HTH domain antitoxin
MKMHIHFEIPTECTEDDSAEHITDEVKLSYALWLFKQARVTIGKAAKLAGLTLYDFMGACKLHQVSVINITEQELRDEIMSSNIRRQNTLIV